jgi:uncharacterized membrane protein YciS (DUF1049 family)
MPLCLNNKQQERVSMKIAIVFFSLGIVQGMIICDWLRAKQQLRIKRK